MKPETLLRNVAFAILLYLPVAPTFGATIPFMGRLAIVFDDSGTARYSGVPIGTEFVGEIDDVSFGGMIAGGGITTVFDCCIAAGGLALTNDIELADDEADLLNALAGDSLFSAGDLIDLVDIEGDAETEGGGRIEVGLSYLLAGTAFDSDDLGNYPFDESDLLMTLFFVFEEDAAGAALYDAVGLVDVGGVAVAEPASLALLCFGIAGLGIVARRRTGRAPDKRTP